jgi:hypothetical protein
MFARSEDIFAGLDRPVALKPACSSRPTFKVPPRVLEKATSLLRHAGIMSARMLVSMLRSVADGY